MKRVFTISAISTITLIAIAVLFSPKNRIGPIPVPPDNDWRTWVSVLESRHCYEAFIYKRLLAEGIDWSYEHYRRRVSLQVHLEDKSLLVRVHLVSEDVASQVSNIIFLSLNDFVNEYTIKGA